MRRVGSVPAGAAASAARTAREAVLEAAERRFAAEGYEAATIEEIARDAGVSRGTPSYFFGSKQALHARVFEAAVARAVDAVEAMLRDLDGANASRDAVITAAVSAVVEFAAADPTFARLVLRELLDPVGASPDTPLPETLEAWVTSPEFIVGVAALAGLAGGSTSALARGLVGEWNDPEFRALRTRQIVEFLLAERPHPLLKRLLPKASRAAGASETGAVAGAGLRQRRPS